MADNPSAELVADNPNDLYEEHRWILPSGDINWNCPGLGGVGSGLWGDPSSRPFPAFHYRAEDVKETDCVDQFRAMQVCIQKYLDLSLQEDEEEEEEMKTAEGVEEAAPVGAMATKEEEGSN